MSVQVARSPHETIDSALKRFRRLCDNENVLGDLRRTEAYVPPSLRRKKKQHAARKRRAAHDAR